MNVIGSKWVLKTKFTPQRMLDCLKARLVAKGYHQEARIDYLETYSLVVHPITIKLVISLDIIQGWNIKQLDIENAFLHGFLFEPIFMSQSEGFMDPTCPNYVCKLNRS